MGSSLLNGLRQVQPDLHAEALLRLELEVDSSLEFPAVWLAGTVLNSLWKLRLSSTRVKKFLVRAELEAAINLLRETRYRDFIAEIERLAVFLLDQQ